MSADNGEVPEGWICTELAPFVESMANGIYKPSTFYDDDGIACLRMYNIQDGYLSLHNIKRM